jgi:hypothetical protein
MAHNDEAEGSGSGGAHNWSWPCTLNKDPAFELTRSSFMVPSDTWQPGGSKITVGGYPVPPLSTGKDLGLLIEACHKDLSEVDRIDRSFTSDLALSMMILIDERKVCIDAYDGPVRHSQYNKVGRHA